MRERRVSTRHKIDFENISEEIFSQGVLCIPSKNIQIPVIIKDYSCSGLCVQAPPYHIEDIIEAKNILLYNPFSIHTCRFVRYVYNKESDKYDIGLAYEEMDYSLRNFIETASRQISITLKK